MEINISGTPFGVASKKRPFHSNCTDEPDPKRPALSSVMAEAVKIDSIQLFCSVVEPFFREIVREEMEAFAAKQEQRSRTRNCEERTLHLRIESNLPKLLYAGEKVPVIHVSLIDSRTGEPTTCLQPPLTLNVVVVDGDFNKDDNENWTEAEFKSFEVKCRGQRPPLITGTLKETMKGGVAKIGGFSFTDNSSWVRSKKFRLGIRVVSGCGVRVREAVSDAFTVLAQRGEAYMKHHPPQPKDEVWRLMKIRKDGCVHKRLTAAGIHTVEQFVHLAAANEEEMRRILGSKMRGRNWKMLYEHANTCVFPQSNNGVSDLQPKYWGEIQRQVHFPHMNQGVEEFSQYLGNVVTPSVDGHHLLSSATASRSLQDEDLIDYSVLVEDVDYFSPYDGGEGCSNNNEMPSFESGSSYPYFGGYVPNFTSNKAVIGWLKLKAALRWGIFVRNRAVQRRVQLTELHD